MRNSLLGFWDGLSYRERLFIGVGGGILVVLLFYSYILAPVENERERLRSALPGMRGELLWMRDASERAKSLKKVLDERRAKVDSFDKLKDVVISSASSFGLAGLNVSSSGRQEASVTIDSAQMEKFLLWADDLQRKKGIKIVSCSVTSRDEPGEVTAQAMIVKP